MIKTLIYFKTKDIFQLQPCAFQFLSTQNTFINDLRDQITRKYRVIFHHNYNYSSIIYGALLNSCHWFKNTAFNYEFLNPNFVYRRLLNLNSSALVTYISRQKSTICFCDDSNQVEYFRDKFKPIFPGQNIPVHLVLQPPYSTTVIFIYSINFTDQLEYRIPYNSCEIQMHQHRWLQLVHKNCTPITYIAYSNTFEKCYVAFRTTYPDDSLYIYYIEFHECPLGFHIDNGSCKCDKHLKAAFSKLKCNIQNKTIICLGGSWIGSTSNRCVAAYAKYCILH